jgi:hypothetical protein
VRVGVEERKVTTFVGVCEDCWMLCGEFDVVDWVDWWKGLSACFCKEN